MALVKCHECGNEVSTEAAACPKCGAKPKAVELSTPTTKRTSSSVNAIVAVIAVTVAVIIGWLNYSPRHKATIPDDEQSVIQHLEQFSSDFQSTSNDLQKDGVAKDQLSFLKKSLFKRNVQNWRGTVEAVDTIFDSVILTIRISDNVKLEQHFAKSDPAINQIASFNIGQKVVFSGQLIREGSITDWGRTESPEIYIRLSSISSI